MSFSTVWDIVGILAVAYVAMRLTFYVASDWKGRRADRADGQGDSAGAGPEAERASFPR